MFWWIRLPFAVPFIFSGLKVASSLSVVGAVVAANGGLGYLITTSMSFFEPGVAWGAVLILAVMDIAFFGAVVVERVCFPWSDSRQTGDRK